VGLYTSIALDEALNVHISYYDISDRELEYLFGMGGVWYMQTLDDYGDVGRYSSLALEPGGQPRIAFYDDSYHGLKLASLVPFKSLNYLTVIRR
jgi:hypothetical protein